MRTRRYMPTREWTLDASGRSKPSPREWFGRFRNANP
jgi:hypothetical protein